MWLSTMDIALETGVKRETVHSWIANGVTIPGVGIVLLEARRMGGRFRIQRDWLDAFLARCNGEDVPEIVNPATEKKRGERDQEAARKALAAP